MLDSVVPSIDRVREDQLVPNIHQPTQQMFKLNPEAEEYLNKAFECIEKGIDKSSYRPHLIGRIALGMKEFNEKKSFELFQLALKEAKDSGRSCINAQVRAHTIDVASLNCPKDARKVIASLKDYAEGGETINFYLAYYGVKDSPLTLQCVETFNQWKNTNDYQKASFARACMGFDVDYALSILDTIKDVRRSAQEVIQAATSEKYQISQTVMQSYLDRINREIQSHPNDPELKLIQLQFAFFYGMKLEEAERWISVFGLGIREKTSYSSRDQILVSLAFYLANDNLKRALDVAMMCADPCNVLEKILASITLDQLDLAKFYIGKIEDDVKRVELHLSTVAYLANKHPENVKQLIPELVNLVESIPDSKELDWEPGMKRRHDASISYLNQKINLMYVVIQICFDVGALEKAEELIHHELYQFQKPLSNLKYKLKEANYYKEKDPIQAERCYIEALAMIEKVNAYDWDPDDIRESIALQIADLNPDVALRIASEMREKRKTNSLLVQLIETTAISNREFAKRCLEQMSEDRHSIFKKAEGYLQMIWA